MGIVNNAITGGAMYATGNGKIYSAVTGREIGVFSGGGSGGGLVSVDLTDFDAGGGAITIPGMVAGVYYKSTDPITSLDVTAVELSASETVLRFTVSGDVASFVPTFPATLRWMNEPTFESGKTYVISIFDGMAVAGEVAV